MKTVLVTGAAGFIGQHTVRALLDRGYQVVAVDWRQGALLDIKAVQPADTLLRMTLHVADIRHEVEMAALFNICSPQAVIHLAAQSAVATSWEDWLADARSNAIGTLNVVEQCRKHGIQRIVYAGSGGTVYGNYDGPLPAQEREPVNPLSPYGVSKMAGEFYVRLSGVSHAVLRYPNVYGPGQPSDGVAGVVAIFVGNVLLDRPCIIWGDGLNAKDYVFIDDVVAANIAALEAEADGVFNIGTGQTVTVKEILDTVAATVGKTAQVDYRPARPGDVRHFALDPGKAHAAFGWYPQVSLAEGVKRTVDAMTRAGQTDKSRVSWARGAGSTPAPATRRETSHAV